MALGKVVNSKRFHSFKLMVVAAGLNSNCHLDASDFGDL